ncbi:ergothioneine synthase-like protein 039 [Elysia marginata]|uniref:Ergothioneine synthase-like protein 039 n=1 Tax=Elysia marginata TaxID=1093978 RepID=A0AAV4JSQ5_9GAST|nr:ergothioneine synthase-like protein 039 [Elysia marginata]
MIEDDLTGVLVVIVFTWVANEVDVHDLVLISHLDRVQNAKAWLVRLWEVVNPRGVVVIVSKDEVWTKDSLDAVLSNRLRFVGEQDLPYTDSKGQRTASVTLWKRVE